MVVFFAAQDGASAVELFGEDESDELVREYQFSEAPLVVGAVQYSIGESVSASDQEDQALAAFIGSLLNEFSQLFGTVLFAGFFEGDEVIVGLKPFENGFAFFDLQVHFAEHRTVLGRRDELPVHFVIPADSFGEFLHPGFHVGIMCFANGPEGNAHEGEIEDGRWRFEFKVRGFRFIKFLFQTPIFLHPRLYPISKLSYIHAINSLTCSVQRFST